MSRHSRQALVRRVLATMFAVPLVATMLSLPSLTAVPTRVLAQDPRGTEPLLPSPIGIDTRDEPFTVIDHVGAVSPLFNPPTAQPPVIEGVKPDRGERGQQVTVTVYGANFDPGARVFIPDGIEVVFIEFIDPERMEVGIAIAHSAPPGARPVSVVGPQGLEGVLPGGFTVVGGESLPDLVVGESRWELRDDDQILLLSAEVWNAGEERSPESLVWAMEPSQDWASEAFPVPSMAPGDREVVQIRLPIPDEQRGSTHTFIVEVDPNNQVPELDEGNNRVRVGGIRIPPAEVRSQPSATPLPGVLDPADPRRQLWVIGVAVVVCTGALLGTIYALRRMVQRRHGRRLPPLLLSDLQIIQGELFEVPGEGRPIRRRGALRAGADHALVVRMGPGGQEWLAPAEEAISGRVAPPLAAGSEPLRVVLSEPNHVPEPQTGTIIVPREGPSSTCRLDFRTRTDEPGFQGRVVVLHGNRVLQTALLRSQVVPSPTDAGHDGSPTLMTEGIIRPSLSDLSSRRKFDVAFVANHSPDNTPGLTTIAGESATFDSLHGLDEVIRQIRDLLEHFVVNLAPTSPQRLDADANVDLLLELALHGRRLYEGIVMDNRLAPTLVKARYLQLVSARDTPLPLEFVYDQPPPRPDARLCPRARNALTTGTCAGCAEMRETPARFICPLGFWGLSRVIERQSLVAARRGHLQGHDFALMSFPTSRHDTLHVLQAGVLGASGRVDEVVPGQVQRVLQALRAATRGNAVLAGSWEEWAEAIKKRSPTLLVLLPHTGRHRIQRRTRVISVPMLEIGRNKQLLRDYITSKHVRSTRSPTGPIVVLLGCKTEDTSIPFQSFSAQFRRQGAAVVVGTLTSVLGRHAAPVAVRFVHDLQRAAAQRGSFGDAFLESRRRALADGLAMALCLVAYGDTDWRLAA